MKVLKKIEFKNPKGFNIVGNCFSVNSDKIVILAHGFTNDKSSDGRFDRLSEALNKYCYDALAIDFTGSGESDDGALTLENQMTDLNAAINFVRSKEYSKIALFGNSFGTLSCLKNYNSNIDTMILTGALTDQMHYEWHEYFSDKQMNDLESKGYFNTESERRHKITHQTLMDFEAINQNELLTHVDCPVLIIHGNNQEDNEELMLLERSTKGMKFLSEDSRLKVIEDGKHGFHLKWHEVIDLTVKWLCDHL